MKVENTQNNRLTKTQTETTRAVEKSQQKRASEAHLDSLSGKDQAHFSEQARLLAKARAALEGTPDIRADLVNSLKEKLAAGAYEVPVDELAKCLATRLKADQ